MAYQTKNLLVLRNDKINIGWSITIFPKY